MEVYEAVRTVLAVRNYTPRAISSEITRRVLEAGRLCASSMNRQPWHFILVDNADDLQNLARLASTGRFISQANMAVAVAIDKTEYAVSDASRAIQSMVLSAWSDGIASNWAGFFGLDEAKAFLRLPDPLDLFAIVAFGYPATSASLGKKKRKAFSEVVHHGRFGNPYNLPP